MYDIFRAVAFIGIDLGHNVLNPSSPYVTHTFFVIGFSLKGYKTPPHSNEISDHLLKV